MKNYYLYFHNGKIKRQPINLNEIYPESYAMDRIPADADIFALIIQSDTSNKKWAGYRTKDLKSGWLKHAFWTDYYPGNLEIEFKDAVLYHEGQIKYIEKYSLLITKEEIKLLETSTLKVKSHLFDL